MAIESVCLPFPANSLLDILCGHLGGLNKNRDEIASKSQVGYLQRYLEILACKTVLVEFPYIDRDYLEDYASYYSRCFTNYDRKCARLHFFSEPFDTAQFLNLLKRTVGELTPQSLEDSYLGFCIINPLPKTFIGRTCLRTYDDEGGRRCYSTIRRYCVHLFGMTLTVNSLAFQEQDSTVAACATSALWSAFNGSGMLFQHAIPSPIEITKIATQYVIQESRPFPNHALTRYQITHAVKALGLDPLTIELNHKAVNVQAYVHAYLAARMPALLLMRDAQGRGGHAITVSGYSLGGGTPSSPEPSSLPTFKLLSSLVDKLYVHDDQTGPFARASLFDAASKLQTYDELNGYKFEYTILVVPVYHKIRIGYATILKAVKQFHFATEFLIDRLGRQADAPYWDIHLSSATEFKNKIYNSTEIREDERQRALQCELPRFIWRAIALSTVTKTMMFELIFDATDITGGCLLLHDIEYTFPMITALRNAITINEQGINNLPGLKQILNWVQQLDGN